MRCENLSARLLLSSFLNGNCQEPCSWYYSLYSEKKSGFDFSEYKMFLLSAACQPLYVIELESLGKKLNGQEEIGLSKL